MRCSGCGEDCRIVSVDFGVGRIEYWGFTSWHSQIEQVSDCCEAPIEEDAESDECITENDMETVQL